MGSEPERYEKEPELERKCEFGDNVFQQTVKRMLDIMKEREDIKKDNVSTWDGCFEQKEQRKPTNENYKRNRR